MTDDEDQGLVECIRAAVRQDSDALLVLNCLLDLIRAALDEAVDPGDRPTDECRFAVIEALLRDALGHNHGVWRCRVNWTERERTFVRNRAPVAIRRWNRGVQFLSGAEGSDASLHRGAISREQRLPEQADVLIDDDESKKP